MSDAEDRDHRLGGDDVGSRSKGPGSRQSPSDEWYRIWKDSRSSRGSTSG